MTYETPRSGEPTHPATDPRHRDPVDPPARDVAASLGVRVVEVGVDVDATGELLGARVPGGPADPPPARAGDLALLLHTSGTTSRPKLVPLTHGNLVTSARNVAA